MKMGHGYMCWSMSGQLLFFRAFQSCVKNKRNSHEKKKRKPKNML